MQTVAQAIEEFLQRIYLVHADCMASGLSSQVVGAKAGVYRQGVKSFPV